MSVVAQLRTAAEDEYDGDPGCARCGSSTMYEQCTNCGGEGARDCYEEDPNWYEFASDDERYERCSMCDGKGGWSRCLSSYDWCEANPLPGQEQTVRTA